MHTFSPFLLACSFLLVGTLIPLYVYFRHQRLAKKQQQRLLKKKQQVELKANLHALTATLEDTPLAVSERLTSILVKLEQKEVDQEVQMLLIKELIDVLNLHPSPSLLEPLQKVENHLDSFFQQRKTP
jgi:hypothetical protein